MQQVVSMLVSLERVEVDPNFHVAQEHRKKTTTAWATDPHVVALKEHPLAGPG